MSHLIRPSLMLTALVLAAAAAAACGGGDDPPVTPPSPTLTSVAIIGNTAFTAAGETSQLQAEARYSSGPAQTVTSQAAWSSTNQGIATVSGAGLVTAVGAGTASINAVYQNVTGTQGVSVAATPVQTLTIAGNTVFTTRNQTSQLTATATLANGSTQNVTATAAWSVADAGVATVSSAALLTAGNNGLSEVAASYQGQRVTRVVETRWSDCQGGGVPFHTNGAAQTPRTALSEQGCQTCHAAGGSGARLDFTRSAADVYNAVLLFVRPRDVNASRLAQFGQSVPNHRTPASVNSCYPGSWCGDLIRRWITEGACAP
ncbi:MAG: Ig-like domain-containing protein [Acidobacteria bacterium]|nr:Ig-like domain-containing protein [Acidobacteriota bacterium]